MTPSELRDSKTVRDLIALQTRLKRPDNDFARSMRFRFSGSTWNKIKNQVYRGDIARIHSDCTAALKAYLAGTNDAAAELIGNTVLLSHVRATLDAVDIARSNTDEHRLVMVAGRKGSGKTRTLSAVHARHPGLYIHARPSWGGGYLQFLKSFAAACGFPSEFRSAGAGETSIIDDLKARPSEVLCLDEFNHCSSNSLNFLKAILNETTWTIAAATLPRHLTWMASSAQTAEEAGQLIRRAVAIIHIPAVSTPDIETLARALWPMVPLDGHTSQLAAAANRLHLLDTVAEVLSDTDPAKPADLAHAIGRYESLKKSTLRPKADD